MKIIYAITVIMLSGFLIVGAICRLKPMHPSEHKHGWAAMYFLMAGFGGFAVIDVLQGDEPSLAVLFGLFAWALNLFNTQGLWHKSPPESTVKK